MEDGQPPSISERLDVAIAEYLQAAESGKSPDRDAWLKRYPDLANELKAFFADNERFEKVSAPLRQAARIGAETSAINESNNHVKADVLNSIRKFGDYEIIQEIARGGMGIVFKARQVSLNRIVALKMVLAGDFASAQEIQRFQSEAEAAACLDHPHILPVYEVGRHESWHYFSMRLAEGGSLAQKLAQGPMQPRDAAQMLLTVSRAVHHAHQHGVLHRDLKPGNILLDPNGQPFVGDFGLAKRIDGTGGVTISGAIIGTPNYMSPEQAAGHSKRASTAADIYSLGAVLYEMITGRPPFECDSIVELLRRVVEQDPERPRKIVATIDRDLEAICMKCLEKDPVRRYASADELADDLARYINGEHITVSNTSLLYRLARTLDRSQHAAEFQNWGTMLILFGTILLCGHTVTFWLIFEDKASWQILLSRSLQSLAMLAVFLRYRPRSVLPTSSIERQLWSIWVGYIIAYVINLFASDLLSAHDLMSDGGLSPLKLKRLISYPSSSVLAGLAFFIMGSGYWGRSYQFGIAFFVLALLMPFKLEYAPLLFGIVWCGVLTIFGLHLRNLRRKNS